VREGLVHGVQDAAGRRLRAHGIGLVHQHHELVAAQARDGVDLAQAGLQPLGHVHQHAVAELVAQGVVDVLEAVEVGEQQRKGRALALRHGDGELHPVGQHAAVGQAGQRVGARQRLDAVDGLQPLADVAVGMDAADHAAMAHLRQHHPLEHAARQQGHGVHHFADLGVLVGGNAVHVGGRIGHGARHGAHDGVVVAPAQQLGRQAPQRREGLVEGADVAGDVGDQHAVRGGLQRRGQFLDAFFQLVLDASALAGIVQHHHEQVVPLAHADPADPARDRDGDAVEAAQPGLGLNLLREPGRGFAPEEQVFRRGAQLHDLAPAQRGRIGAHQRAGRGIGGHHAQGRGVDEPHGVEHAVDQSGRELDAGQRHAFGHAGSFHAMASSGSLAASKK